MRSVLRDARGATGSSRSRRFVGLALVFALLLSACGSAEELIDEQTGGTLPDLSVPDLTTPDLTVPDFTIPDLNAPDFTVPDIVAPDIDVIIEIIEAPELPVIRFPEAISHRGCRR